MGRWVGESVGRSMDGTVGRSMMSVDGSVSRLVGQSLGQSVCLFAGPPINSRNIAKKPI